MALTPLNTSHRLQVREYRGQPGTYRTTHLYELPWRPACTTFSRPKARPVASRERFSRWMWLDRYYDLYPSSGIEGMVSAYQILYWETTILEYLSSVNVLVDDSWPDFIMRIILHEKICIPDGSWDHDSSAKVEKAVKSYHLGLARVFEYMPRINSVALHKSHAHPDGIPTRENTDDDVELLSNDLMGRELVER